MANPEDPSVLHTVRDGYYGESRIYRVDVAAEPARITNAIGLTREGAPVAYLEGIAPAGNGGFWFTSGGSRDGERSNLLVKAGVDDTVEREVVLPEAVDAKHAPHGFEGVAAMPVSRRAACRRGLPAHLGG